MLLGSLKNKTDLILNTNITKGPIKLLSIYISGDPNEIFIKNYQSKLDSLLRQLHWWKARDLSLYGRVLIVKTLALSKFLYLASLIPIPKNIINIIKSEIYEFIWKGKTDKVKREIFEQEFAIGGFKMFDFIDIIKASSVIWIKRYLDTIDRNWKSMFECFCNKTNLPVFLQSNFDVSELPPNLPLYYKNSIIIWQSVSHHVTNNNLLSNCLWYNKGIKLGGKSVYSKNLMSIGMWTVADLYECDGQTVIPFSTWQKRGAVELDRLTWLGIVNVVKPIRNTFCKSCIISAGIVVNDKFISIQKVTQRDIKNSLSKKKYSKLKELDFKFKIKANSIHGNLNDEIWKRLFLSCHQVNMNKKTKGLVTLGELRDFLANRAIFHNRGSCAN